jgi:type VI secretion system secreted protein VgrG
LPETGEGNKTINVDSQTGADKTSGHLHHLKDATHNLERNTNTDKDSQSGAGEQPGQQPLLILSGQNGIALTTPQSATLASGSNLDHIAQRDLHQSTGKRWIHNVGESISIFVAGAQNKIQDTLKLLAGQGDIQVQAQSGEIEITADKNIRLHALKQKQTWSAQKNILVTCGGAYLKLEGGGVQLHCPGTLTFKGSQHNVPGPAGMNPVMPVMPTLSTTEQWAKVQYNHPAGEPVYGKFLATDGDGKVLSGMLNAKGEALVPSVTAAGNVLIELVKKP